MQRLPLKHLCTREQSPRNGLEHERRSGNAADRDYGGPAQLLTHCLDRCGLRSTVVSLLLCQFLPRLPHKGAHSHDGNI